MAPILQFKESFDKKMNETISVLWGTLVVLIGILGIEFIGLCIKLWGD